MTPLEGLKTLIRPREAVAFAVLATAAVVYQADSAPQIVASQFSLNVCAPGVPLETIPNKPYAAMPLNPELVPQTGWEPVIS